MNKTTLFVIAILACGFTISGSLIYIQRPVNAFRANVQPYPILTKKVNIGGEVKWHSNSCHIHNLPFESTRKLKNVDTGVVVEIPEHNTLSQTAVGKCAETDRTFILPSSFGVGTYKLIFEVRTTVNRWNINTIIFETDTFQIIKGEIGEGIKIS